MFFVSREFIAPPSTGGFFIQTLSSQRHSHLLDLVATSRMRLAAQASLRLTAVLQTVWRARYIHLQPSAPLRTAVLCLAGCQKGTVQRGYSNLPCRATERASASGHAPSPFRDICFAAATPVCGRSAQRVVHPPVMCRRGAAVPPPRPRAQRLSPWLRCGAATCFSTPFAASWRLQAPWARSAHPFFDLPER